MFRRRFTLGVDKFGRAPREATEDVTIHANCVHRAPNHIRGTPTNDSYYRPSAGSSTCTDSGRRFRRS